MNLRIDHTNTNGIFSLDGEVHNVENNVWVLGDDRECVVVDAPHDVAAIATLIGDRHLKAILCTHAHDDHVSKAIELSDQFDAPIWLHAADLPVWQLTFPDRRPDRYLEDGQILTVADHDIHVLHTPGHAPGAVCFYVEHLGVLFSGDTLFAGGPGATGRSFSSFPTIVESIRSRILTLPEATVVHTGHGESTTVGKEAPHLDEWIARDS